MPWRFDLDFQFPRGERTAQNFSANDQPSSRETARSPASAFAVNLAEGGMGPGQKFMKDQQGYYNGILTNSTAETSGKAEWETTSRKRKIGGICGRTDTAVRGGPPTLPS